jgi:hypothetical protein
MKVGRDLNKGNFMDNSEMDETMSEIEKQDLPVRPANMRDNLKIEISKIEKNINEAQAAVNDSNSSIEPAHSPITPEQANVQKKDLVFLRKDLRAKEMELKELDDY